jgi:hypothetical protein
MPAEEAQLWQNPPNPGPDGVVKILHRRVSEGGKSPRAGLEHDGQPIPFMGL